VLIQAMRTIPMLCWGWDVMRMQYAVSRTVPAPFLLIGHRVRQQRLIRQDITPGMGGRQFIWDRNRILVSSEVKILSEVALVRSASYEGTSKIGVLGGPCQQNGRRISFKAMGQSSVPSRQIRGAYYWSENGYDGGR
jgi:hypothetical protein